MPNKYCINKYFRLTAIRNIHQMLFDTVIDTCLFSVVPGHLALLNGVYRLVIKFVQIEVA
jgi:hypothetical protein